MREGVLIGADEAAEDLLSWWWDCYARHERRPVAIVDFGMTEKARGWCEARMTVIPLEERAEVARKEAVAEMHVQAWSKRYTDQLWRSRKAWFQKPRACLLSPFDHTLWLDLDCEVCEPLDSLFGAWEKDIELAIVRGEPWFSEFQIFNSGVLLFDRKAPFLAEWCRLCAERQDNVMGDQDVLLELILLGKVKIKELLTLYNWLMFMGFAPGIVIAHWASSAGKDYIRKYGGLQRLSITEKVEGA